MSWEIKNEKVKKGIPIALIVIGILILFFTVAFFYIKFHYSEDNFINIMVNNDLISKNIITCSKKFNIDSKLLLSIMWVESRLDENATNTNKNGSTDRGLMQLNSNTFKNLKPEQCYDIDVNILVGSKHLAELLIKYKGNELKSLMAYNCGEYKVNIGNIPQSTLDYANKVYEYRNKLSYLYAKFAWIKK